MPNTANPVVLVAKPAAVAAPAATAVPAAAAVPATAAPAAPTPEANVVMIGIKKNIFRHPPKF